MITVLPHLLSADQVALARTLLADAPWEDGHLSAGSQAAAVKNNRQLPHGTEAPFPPTWAHRIIVVGCLWLGKDYRLKKLGVIGDERADVQVPALGLQPRDAAHARDRKSVV